MLVLDAARLAPWLLPRVGNQNIVNYVLKWSMVPARQVSLAAGVERWVDLAYALELPPTTQGSVERRLCLPVKEHPWPALGIQLDPRDWQGEGHVFEPGSYRLHVVVAAVGVRARHYTLDVTLLDSVQEPNLVDALRVSRTRRARRPRRLRAR